MKILITGSQGSGKTTQAKILADKLGLCFVGAGDLLREYAEGEGKKAAGVKATLEKGELADDELLADLMKKKISEESCRGIVVDGYPRTFDQHLSFDPGYDKIFYLEISDSEAKKRLLTRGRADDTPAAIAERLSWFHNETKPLFAYYRSLGKLEMIDGERSIEVVAKDIGERVKGL